MENFCERHRCNMEMRCPKCGPTATDLQAEVERLREVIIRAAEDVIIQDCDAGGIERYLRQALEGK